jgi:hypothetical protein
MEVAKEESVPMVAETQTIAGTSQDPSSPMGQEEPPVLTPASDLIPLKKGLLIWLFKTFTCWV